jgi:hypothetical protein
MRDSAGHVVQKAPTVLTQKDLDAIPRGGKYWYQDRLLTKWGGTPAKDTAQATPTPSTIRTEEESKAYFSATPVPTPSTGILLLRAVTAVIAFVLVVVAVIGLVIYVYKLKPKPKSADPGTKRIGQIYSDQAQFQLAMRLWDRDRLLFEQNETSRLAQLNEIVKKKGGPFSSLVGVGSVITAFLVGGAHGVGYGFGTFFLGMFAVGMIMSVEEHFYRWRHAGLFVRREFAEPQPIYQQQAEPPPRTEPRQETPPNEPAIVTSMRQAYEILGLPPGRITLDAVRTVYRTRMMEYHPDRVTHLGPELRKLAERKAKQFNLAMEFIEREAK